MQVRHILSTLLPTRFHWLIVATAFTVLTVISVNISIVAQSQLNTLHNVQTELLRQSLTLSELADRTIQSVDLVVRSVVEKARMSDSEDGDLTKLNIQDFHILLKEKIAGLPQIAALGVIDADGTNINNTRSWPAEHYTLSDRDYFQALKNNPSLTYFISEPIENRSNGTWVIIIARPILTPENKFVGVVYASTALEYFENIFRATSLGDGYAVALMRDDGVLLARYPVAGTVGKSTPASVLKTLVGANFGVSRSVSPVDQQARVAAARRFANYPLVVVCSENEEIAFAAWRTSAITTSGIAAVVIFFIVAAALLIARSWTQQERLNKSDKTRALAEAESVRQRDFALQNMRFRAAVDNLSQGLCMFDNEKRLVVSNGPYAKMYRLPEELLKLGTPRDEIIAHCVRNGILGGNCGNDAVLKRLSELSVVERSCRVDEHADGKLVRVTGVPMEGGGWVATHEDITEQRRAELNLEETKKFLDSIISNIPIAVVVKDATTRKFVLVNQAYEVMFGALRTELIGKTAFDVFRPEDAELMDKSDSALLQGSDEVKSAEVELNSPHRGTRVFATKRITVQDTEGNNRFIVVVIDDITERKQHEWQITFMAHHDALTGLANRASVAQKIEEAAARQRRHGECFSVLLLDLDRFKQVNDTLGHPCGDSLLRDVATRLMRLLRETDAIARLGGDEFVIIQAGESKQEQGASALADRILDILTKPFCIEGHEVNISASIGIALAPEHGTNPDELLKMADLALYRAKSAGRNGYRFFASEMSEIANTRKELEGDLRRAIQNNELVLHYQPIIDTKTRRICGAEALVRWRHPTRGLIAPDRFIPLAEETGLITRIGDWVLHTACNEAATWPHDVKISVNLSPVQFRESNLPDVVMCILAESGLPPERLELEITETALIESAAECLPVLRRFKNLGITVALDDFGTGYSSLSQLTMFPFDKIKIDKSFTQNMTKRAECAAIIAGTLTLAQSLGIATTAEGVETADQYELLRLAGVTSLQGYLFKRPGPAFEIDFKSVYGGSKIEDAA